MREVRGTGGNDAVRRVRPFPPLPSSLSFSLSPLSSLVSQRPTTQNKSTSRSTLVRQHFGQRFRFRFLFLHTKLYVAVYGTPDLSKGRSRGTTVQVQFVLRSFRDSTLFEEATKQKRVNTVVRMQRIIPRGARLLRESRGSLVGQKTQATDNEPLVGPCQNKSLLFLCRTRGSLRELVKARMTCATCVLLQPDSKEMTGERRKRNSHNNDATTKHHRQQRQNRIRGRKDNTPQQHTDEENISTTTTATKRQEKRNQKPKMSHMLSLSSSSTCSW